MINNNNLLGELIPREEPSGSLDADLSPRGERKADLDKALGGFFTVLERSGLAQDIPVVPAMQLFFELVKVGGPAFISALHAVDDSPPPPRTRTNPYKRRQ